ncbi:MAG: hypothetical protein AABN34_15245 [Acidobacteriota bacterium]
MDASFHLASVPISQTDRYLLFQTLRGAVDIVPADIALALKRSEHLASTSLSEAEADILTRRGYLTDQLPEQERQQSRAALRLTAKQIRPSIEMIFRFPPDSSLTAKSAVGADLIAEVFSIAAELAREEGLLMVSPEITTPEVGREVMNHIVEAATQRDYPLLPQVTIAGLGALWPWLKSENFRQVTLSTNNTNMSLDVQAVTEKIVDCFENQVYVSWKCTVDEMSVEQMGAVRAVCEGVRQKYSNFMLLPLSEKRETPSAASSIATENVLPVIETENAVVLSTLLRFITMPTMINYNPFFHTDPDKLILDIGSAGLSYESATGNLPIEGADAVRRSAASIAAQKREKSWEAIEQTSQCPACRFSLVCGRDWIGKCGYSSIDQCATSFERRMEQVLPLLFFNLRGNWRPPEASQVKA